MKIQEAAKILGRTEESIQEEIDFNNNSTLELSFRVARDQNGQVYGGLTQRGEYADDTIGWI